MDAAVAWLTGVMPLGWTAERSSLQVGNQNSGSTLVDPVINLKGSNATAQFLVEARRSITPRDVERLVGGLSRALRGFTNVSVLVVAPWISARTQDVLRREDINYVDLTGNAWIRSSYPAVVLSTTGASRNPAPVEREVPRLRGPKAGRLVRALVDVRPPYRVQELAKATRLNPGYVSRLLDALDREALADRGHRGEVTAVDYPALLRRWVETYDVTRSNDARRFVAPEGARKSLQRLKSSPLTGRVAVTGSFAAVRLAPVAAPALLLAYVEDVGPTADALSLLSADEGANVILLRPFDEAVWSGLDRDEGITYVAPSQAAADCLTGSGRMPAEGEAVLGWMEANEDAWRRRSLRDLADTDHSS